MPLGGTAGTRGRARRRPSLRADVGPGRGGGAGAGLRGELDLSPADRRRRGTGAGRPAVAQGRRDEPGTVRRAAQRHAARRRAALPRIRFPERRPYRAGHRADRGGIRRDAGPPAGEAAAVTDLALTGGRVVDPSRGIDDSLGVAVTGGRLTGLGAADLGAADLGAAGP